MESIKNIKLEFGNFGMLVEKWSLKACKERTLNSKKCWNSKGKSICSDSLVILRSKKFRMFKDL